MALQFRDRHSELRGFLDRKACVNSIELIDQFCRERPERVWVDPLGSDHRIFCAAELGSGIAEFEEAVARAVSTSAGLKVVTTVVGQTRYVEGNLGSGQGWHQDQPAVFGKVLAYLCSVDDDNGPLQLVDIDIDASDSASPRGRRYSDEEVRETCERYTGSVRTLCGMPGDAVCFNPRRIHRGKPLNKGIRYSLTSYFARTDDATSSAARFQSFRLPPREHSLLTLV
jgi:Phytanoyl-CoA dioxygenase (PhyH)